MQQVKRTKLVTYFLIYFCLICNTNCEAEKSMKSDKQFDIGKELVEQGRTLVKGTFKRLLILAPAVFFKLGIAFTLLLLVTLVATSNGFIGFLILVVGLSSVLARLQGSAAPLIQPVPISYASLPQISHHHHNPWIDRSDKIDMMQKASQVVNGYYGTQSFDSNSDLRNTGVYYKNRLPNAA